MPIDSVSLREYIDRRFEDQDKAIQAALAAAKEAVGAALVASEKAVDKAEVTNVKWRENSNEWRGAMSDREKDLTSRVEFAAFKDSIEKTLSDLIKTRDTNQGRSTGLSSGWGYLIGFVGILATILSIISFFIKQGN